MYRSSYYRRRWGSIDGFLDSIGKSRTEAGLNRVYSEKEIIVIYSLIKILLSVIKESTNYKINHTVLEQLQFEGKSLISPSTISKKFGGWDNFLQYIQSNGIDLSLEKTIKHIQEQGSLFLQEQYFAMKIGQVVPSVFEVHWRDISLWGSSMVTVNGACGTAVDSLASLC